MAPVKYKIPQKEDIIEYYITQNHTKEECIEHFGTSSTTFTRWLSFYQIKKDLKLMGERLKQKATEKMLSEIPSREELYNKFIIQLKGKKEISQEYKVPESRITEWLKYYDIYKDPSLTGKTNSRLIEKTGVDPSHAIEVNEKRKKTCLEKYGYDNPSKNKEIIQKIKEKKSFTLPDKEEFHDLLINKNYNEQQMTQHFQVSRSTIERWGKQLEIKKSTELIQAKREETCIKKYGYSFYTKTEEYKEKTVSICLDKYGVPNPSQINIQKFEIWESREKFIELLKSFEIKPSVYELAKEFNVCYASVMNRVHSWGLENLILYDELRSSYENEVVNFINSLGNYNIKLNDRSVLEGYEIDIYLPDQKFGIEFNGDYWHSDLHPRYQDHGGRSTVHQNKSLKAEEKGVFLFQIFEHEWDPKFYLKNPKQEYTKENIENRIRTILQKNNKKIGAKKCEIKEISKEQKKKFLRKNHIQGNDHSAYYLGLFYKEELVACMTFTHSKYKKYKWELSRFCNLQGYTIQGGASKLFQYFVKNQMKIGDKVVSYSDITKTKGDLYRVLNFDQVSIGAPNYWWINFDTYDVRTRYQEQAAGEVERMHSLNYHRVCDCGTKTWVYEKKVI